MVFTNRKKNFKNRKIQYKEKYFRIRHYVNNYSNFL